MVVHMVIEDRLWYNINIEEKGVETMENKQFLKDYGFSEFAIKKLLKKEKFIAPYGVVEIKGDELITTYENGEIKKEKIQ
jgi:hypothetical protein